MKAKKVVTIGGLAAAGGGAAERMSITERFIGCETLDYTKQDIQGELREMTGGRGPDVCIEAVGMEAHSDSPSFAYDWIKQQAFLQTDRPTAHHREDRRHRVQASRVEAGDEEGRKRGLYGS